MPNEEFALNCERLVWKLMAGRGLHTVGIAKPAPLHPELLNSYVNRLAELRARFDSAYQMSDDFTFFKKHDEIRKEIAWLENTLAKHS